MLDSLPPALYLARWCDRPWAGAGWDNLSYRGLGWRELSFSPWR